MVCQNLLGNISLFPRTTVFFVYFSFSWCNWSWKACNCNVTFKCCWFIRPGICHICRSWILRIRSQEHLQETNATLFTSKTKLSWFHSTCPFNSHLCHFQPTYHDLPGNLSVCYGKLPVKKNGSMIYIELPIKDDGFP
jgi:hypothetical protein